MSQTSATPPVAEAPQPDARPTDQSAPDQAGQPGATDPSQRIVWIDCEMTGLDLASDALVEIACVVTEADLTQVDDGITIVIRPPDKPFAAMDPFVVDMHHKSGLIHEIPEGVTLDQAAEAVLAYVKQQVPEARKAPLAGSTI